MRAIDRELVMLVLDLALHVFWGVALSYIVNLSLLEWNYKTQINIGCAHRSKNKGQKRAQRRRPRPRLKSHLGAAPDKSSAAERRPTSA